MFWPLPLDWWGLGMLSTLSFHSEQMQKLEVRKGDISACFAGERMELGARQRQEPSPGLWYHTAPPPPGLTVPSGLAWLRCAPS